MNFIKTASLQSILRGIEYCRENKVLSWKQIDNNKYEGVVAGSNGTKYEVYINLDKPKSSMCNCPHADGNRVTCKHKIALFFTIFPEERVEFEKYIANDFEEEEKEEEEGDIYERLMNKIHSMSKSELQDYLIDVFNGSPDYMQERILNDLLD